jgi:hypothetical protein
VQKTVLLAVKAKEGRRAGLKGRRRENGISYYTFFLRARRTTHAGVREVVCGRCSSAGVGSAPRASTPDDEQFTHTECARQRKAAGPVAVELRAWRAAGRGAIGAHAAAAAGR